MKKDELQAEVISIVGEALATGKVPEASIARLLSMVYSQMKPCSYECKRLLPATVEYFARHPKTKDGLQSYCRDCGNLVGWRKEQRKKEELLYSTDYVENIDELDYREDEKELDYSG